MKILIASVLLAVACTPPASQNSDIEAIKKLNSYWINSSPRKDIQTFERIFADDFILINPKGTKITKAQVLSAVNQNQIVSVKFDSLDVKLVTESVGILTAYTTFVLKVDGKDLVGKNCYQDVYVKRNNNWQAVAAHVTLLDTESLQ